MGIAKYRYYWKKPKSEITKDILSLLLVGGALVVGGAMAGGGVAQMLWRQKSLQKYPKRNIQDRFTYLRKRGFIKQEVHSNQLYVSLTEEGKKKAGMFQINELQIARPKKWGGKWYLLLFDISEKRKIKREALRGMLKQMDFFPLQKSVWVHAFDCRAEVDLLKEFFGLGNDQVRLVIAEEIGDSEQLKRVFGVL